MIDASLRQALVQVAGHPRLIVASDYDGTLSPIVDDPAKAGPHEHALNTLFEIAELPAARAVIVSGRSEAMLRHLTHPPPSVTLVGDHGADVTGAPDPAVMAELVDAMNMVADRFPGSQAEPKSLGVAFHYRRAHDQPGAALAALELAERFDSRVIEGKKVVEVVLGEGDKGSAITALRNKWNADAVVFFGDDTTDEDVFSVLTGDDVGVKVGSGETLARFRVDDPQGVADALALLRDALLGELASD